jgi:hypothetical protein
MVAAPVDCCNPSESAARAAFPTLSFHESLLALALLIKNVEIDKKL